jgi:hypothetical protein
LINTLNKEARQCIHLLCKVDAKFEQRDYMITPLPLPKNTKALAVVDSDPLNLEKRNGKAKGLLIVKYTASCHLVLFYANQQAVKSVHSYSLRYWQNDSLLAVLVLEVGGRKFVSGGWGDCRVF